MSITYGCAFKIHMIWWPLGGFWSDGRRPCPATLTWRSCSKGLRDSSHTNCWQTILKKYSECCTIGNHQGVGTNTIPDWPKASKNLTANKCTAIEVSGAGNKLNSSFSFSQIKWNLMQIECARELAPQKTQSKKDQERIFPNTC